MTARHVQYLLAAVFGGLGGWCVLLPGMVETLVFQPEFRELSATSRLMIQCFGAQAVLVAVLMSVSVLPARGFLVFGLAGSLPFFVFNYHFLFVAKMFTPWLLLDFVGNLAILGLGLWGYRLKRRADAGMNDSRWQDLY